MSDFLSSLRSTASRIFEGSGPTQAQVRDAQVRQSPEYAAAARRFVGTPDTGFRLTTGTMNDDARNARATMVFNADVSPTGKDIVQQGRDAALDLTSGFVGGALNIAALAGSSYANHQRLMGNNIYDVGVPIGEFAGRTTEFLSNLRTQEAKDASSAYGVTQDIIQADNRQAELDAVAGGANKYVAGAQRIFNDVVDTGANVLRQPEALGSGVSQGVGSLLLGGPVAKGATAVATGGARALASRGLLSEAAALRVAGAVEKHAMTGSIAAMEAGGAYTQASGEVMAMSHDELLANSPQYVQLLERGMSPDAAKNQIASRAGSIAAAIQAPVAAATGRLVAGFEAAPLAGTTIRGALQNVGKEAIEEGIQSFSGGLSSNIGLRASANVNQDLAEGVGAGLAEGAIFGAGTAGVFAGPSAATGTVQRGVEGARRKLGEIMETGKQRNEANIVRPEQASQAVRTAAQPVVSTGDAEIDANLPVLTALSEQFHFDQATYQPSTPAEANLLSRLNPEEQHDIWDVMKLGSDMIADPSTSPEDKTDLALMVFSLYSGVTDEAVSQVADLQAKATPGGALASELNRIIAGQEAVAGNPLILKALQDGLAATPDVTVEQIEDVSTPEGQRALQKAATQALFSPETLSPEVAERLMRHSTKRPELFSQRQLINLRTATALNQTFKKAVSDAELMGLEIPATARVASNVQVDSYDQKNTTGPSVAMHAQNVTNALAQGNIEAAVEYMEQFRNFAQHMSNKLNAVNSSFQGREEGTIRGKKIKDANPTVKFDSFSPKTGEWTPGGGSIGIARFSPGSIALGQQVGVDAEYAIDSFNALVQQFPGMGINPVEQTRLADGLKRKPAEVVTAAQAEQRGETVEAKAQPEQATATPEPETPPVQEEPEQLELPLTAERVKKARSEGIYRQIALIEDRMDFGTPLPNDEVNLRVLKAERDAREEALLTEPSELVEDTKPEPQPAPEVVEEVAEPEAEPEVQATETTAEIEKKTPAITEVFPDLVRDTNGEQLLIDGFTLDNAARTRLIGEDAVSIVDVQEALSSPEAFQALTGFGRHKLTPQVSAAYTQTMSAVLSRVFPKMEERMKNSKHFKPYLNGAQPGNAIRRVNLRLLNLMQFSGEQLVFADKIGEAATLALTDWLAQNSISGPQRSDEDIARKLRIDINDVTNELRLAYNSSISSQQAHDSLAQTLTQFLGLKPKSDVKNGYTDGLMLSMAGELLAAAQEVGLINVTPPIKIGDNYVVFMKTDKEGLGLGGENESDPSFAGQTTLISQIIQQDESVAGYTLNAPSGNRLSKLQGGGAPTTEAQNKAARTENAVPQTVNRPILDLYRHLSLDGIVDLFGNGQLDDTLNKNDREAKEGQNLSFVSAYETVMGLVQEMESASVDANVELEEVKLYREYAFSSVNRMQQQGQYGDQSSKLVREMITPYATTLDLTNEADLLMWRRGIAQALGVKVEKLRPENWQKKLDQMLADPAVQSAIAMLADPTATPSDQLIAGLKDALDPTGEKGVTPVQVHALKSYADYVQSNDPSEFFTHVYVEADGVTDGPTNSLIYMRTGGFDVEMVRGLARGGLMFSEAPVALHEIFDPEVGDVLPDTYEISGQRLSENLSDHINEVIASGENAEQQQALSHQTEALMLAMRVLLGGEGFSYIDNVDGTRTYTIGRKQLKNPLTVTVYGSSPAGIAAKIAKEMTRLIHAEVSSANKKAAEAGTKDWQQFFFDGADNRDILLGSLAQLARNETKVYRNKVTGLPEYKVVPNKNQQVIQNFSSAKDFTVTPNAVKGLTQALQAFYVTPMVDAINQGMGSSVNGSQLIQKATNFLSVLARNAYANAIQKELEKEVANGGRMADGLSPDTLKTVLSRVAFLFPYMEDGSITVNVKGLQKGYMDDKPNSDTESAVRPAATFSDNIHTKLTIPMPAVAGVAGAAYVNISYGDGRMIIEASPNLVGGRLMVFDGINLALKDAHRNGVAINKTVLDALQSGTPFADLSKTFSNMRETIGLDAFSEAELSGIVSDLTPPGVTLDVADIDFIQSEMLGIQNQLNSAVLDEKARQNVLKRVHLSSDHMAALAAPASTSGDASREDLSKLSDEDKAHRLEALFREERAKLENAKKVPAPKEDLGELVQAMKADASGARVATTAELAPMIEKLNIPGPQKVLMRRALKALEDTNWTVVLGSQEQANAYTKSNGVPFTFGEGDQGVADMANKVMIITNQSSETLAHELIHAATLDRVAAYYADPAMVDEVSRGAIERLHLLMDEWLSSSYEAAGLRNLETREAVANAIVTVSNLINDGKQAEALNEFMAWNLSNQNLMKLNSTIKVENKLARIAKGVLDGLKKLFGIPSSDLASNIRFNSLVLMRDGMPTLAAQAADRILRHTSRARADLRELAEKFTNMLRTVDAPYAGSKGATPGELALQVGYQVADTVSKNGFPLTAEERPAFARIVAAYRVNSVADPKLNTQMDILMQEVLDQLDQTAMMDNPNSQDPGELQLASDRINLLNGSVDVGTDVSGRSLLVPMFVALGATSATAQKLLNRIEVRNKKAAAPGTTVDTWVRGKASGLIDKLMDYSYGLKPGQKVAEQIQGIVAATIAEQDALKGQLTQALEAPANFIREANEKSAKVIGKGIDLTSDGLDYLAEQARGTKAEAFTARGVKIAQTAINLFHKEKAADATSTIFSKINETDIPQELRALWSELLGVTDDNVDVLQLVKVVRSTIHRIRQTYRKLLPQQISDQFSEKLTDTQWNDIHRGLGQADVSVLLDQGLSAGGIIDLFANPKEAKRLLDQKEADIRRLFPNAQDILTDAADLADLMLNGAPAHGFVRRNALAIANRAGTATVGNFAQDSAEVRAVDGYASLLAMSQLGDNTLKSLSALATRDREAMAYTLSQIAYARRGEMAQVPARLRFNVPKGYMPYERRGTMKAVTPAQLNDLTKAGYRVVGRRERGAAEALYDARSADRIYVASDVPPPSFKQGILQTVRSTVFGLDAATGLSYDNPTAGLISGPTVVKRLTTALQKGRMKENLAPLFNEQGQVYGFERLVARADVDTSIETQRNAAVAVGHWMGRQFEEVQSATLNDVLIQRLADRWAAASNRGTQTEFVDLFELAETDPVVADAINLINLRDRNTILDKMGGKFMVERSLYEQVIGYRSISVGDLWTGNTRLGKENREAVANFLTGLLGVDAYRRLTVVEQGWQNLMGDARVAIVVKSMLVPAINAITNFFQLMANGIGPVEIAKKSAEKLRETHLYAQNHLKYQGLEADLAAAKGAKRPDRIRQIETEMRKIEDLNKRLSIWPLIQAGEFTQVTEGLTQDDLEMTRGRVWDHVSKLADKLPPAVKTAGRYAVVAKDTALFEGLARTVAYTDFVAKAVLYDHLKGRMKLSDREAMLRVTNEFVNYDLLGGRMRSKAEEVGLFWFWAFKLRSIKVAVSMLRNNPLHALLTGMAPGVDIGGTVIDDNMLSLFTDGRWDNSLGPDNALRGLALNPLAQML